MKISPWLQNGWDIEKAQTFYNICEIYFVTNFIASDIVHTDYLIVKKT